jgi:diketogulonate reductase-like aldo/keto reductase
MAAPNQTIRVQGVEVPALGFGTWQITGDDAREPDWDA